MNKFNVGDIIVGTSHDKYQYTKSGWQGRVISQIASFGSDIRVENMPGFYAGQFEVDSKYFTLVEGVKPKKTIMKTLSNMMKKLLDADTQTLAKAEYINGDLELTSTGRDALLTILFVANKAEMVKSAQEEIDEAKKDCE